MEMGEEGRVMVVVGEMVLEACGRRGWVWGGCGI